MTEDLRSVLELATDGIDGPDLARTALETARRRRTRRRGVVVGLAAGVAVAGVVVVPRLVDHDPGRERPSGQPTPSPTPDPSPTQSVPPDLPPIPDGVRHPAWDPATAPGLPVYPIESLPTVLVPEGSSSSPGDREEPLVLSRSPKDELYLEYGDRAWYGLRRPAEGGDLWDSALSRDGERIAVVGEGGLFWCDAVAVCPSWTRVQVPARVVAEGARITWAQDSGKLILTTFQTGYQVDLDTGLLVELPFLGGDTAFDIAPDGRLITRPAGSLSITEFDGTTGDDPGARTPELGTHTFLSAFEDAIVATRVTDDGDDGLVVLDRDDLGVRKFLPIEGDVRGMVRRGELRPVGWLNKATILFSVLEPGTQTIHLVTWDLATWDEYGEENHGRVASYPASYDVSLRDLYPA